MQKIVIAGAGQAGASLAAKLRSEGFGGAITLIGDESAPPYQRPPLSKAYLLGEMDRERLFLRPKAWYAENGIDLRVGTRVTGVDAANREVIADGERISYDALALCAGSSARTLPAAQGGGLGGVFTVRTLEDVDRMEPAMRDGSRVLVVGGGYIGLEAAAVATKFGLEVTVLEMADRILSRVAAAETSGYVRAVHADHGVTVREGVGLDRLLGDDRVTGARLVDGTELDVDIVVAGIGILPNTGLGEAAGVEIENGIRTDGMGRTSDPAIWAAGDCASLPYQGRRIRLESVQNAIDQAEAVAKNILGANESYDPKPWFWSDQYDLKLQIAGLNAGYDAVHTRPGEGGAESFWYYAGERLIAVDAMNDPRAYMVGKRLIEMGKSPAPERVTTEENLKNLIKG